MEKEDLELLVQTLPSLEDAIEKLEKSQKINDPASFNQAKKLILQIQRKISSSLG